MSLYYYTRIPICYGTVAFEKNIFLYFNNNIHIYNIIPMYQLYLKSKNSGKWSICFDDNIFQSIIKNSGSRLIYYSAIRKKCRNIFFFYVRLYLRLLFNITFNAQR